MAPLTRRPPVVNPLASLPPPPPTLPIWAKALYYVAETIAIGVGFSSYDFGSPFAAAEGGTDTGDPDTWRRFVFHYADNQSGESADDQVFTIDLVNLTGGQIDSSWTQGDYDLVNAALNEAVVIMQDNVVSRLTLDRVDAYVMAFRPYSDPKPFAESGPPEHRFLFNVPGRGNPQIPPQSTTTVTEETPLRAHWGRMYLPTIGAQCLSITGRLDPAFHNAFAHVWADAYLELMAGQLFPVVATTRVNKQPLRALQTVTGIRVDDVMDVHRSRRHARSQTKTILPLVASTRPGSPAGSS